MTCSRVRGLCLRLHIYGWLRICNVHVFSLKNLGSVGADKRHTAENSEQTAWSSPAAFCAATQDEGGIHISFPSAAELTFEAETQPPGCGVVPAPWWTHSTLCPHNVTEDCSNFPSLQVVLKLVQTAGANTSVKMARGDVSLCSVTLFHLMSIALLTAIRVITVFIPTRLFR